MQEESRIERRAQKLFYEGMLLHGFCTNASIGSVLE